VATQAGGNLEVTDLPRGEISQAVRVLARGMRDNPLHIAAFGEDPQRRLRALERMFGALFRTFTAQTPICARRDGVIVGVTGVAPTPTCQPTTRQRLRLAPSLLALGPRTASRVGRWIRAWAERDPADPHSHLGPLAVDAHLQGQGIGGRIMEEYCRRLDAEGMLGYLETDKPENVRFYERYGFETVDQAEVIGVPNWFMRRSPRSG
jgi:GNAT superfamily N-acetyltransferase